MSESDTRTNTEGPKPEENSIPVPEETPNPAKQEDNTNPTTEKTPNPAEQEDNTNPTTEETSNPKPEVTSNTKPEVTSNPTPEVTSDPTPEVTSNPTPDEQKTDDSNNQPASETNVTESPDTRPTDPTNPVPNGGEDKTIENSRPLPLENEPPSVLQRHISVPTMSFEEKREFYREILSPCGELSQSLKEKAELELNETDSVRSEKLLELRKMLTDEGDTEKGDPVSEYFGGKEDKYLLRFLRTKKFDVKQTYDMMEAYVKFRVKYQTITDQLTYNGVRHALEESFPGVLPVRDKQGHVVIIYDNGSLDYNKLSFDEILASFLFLLENLVENEENQIRGFVVLETYEDYHISSAMRMKPSDIKKLVDMLQGAFPGRFKGFHVIRQPWYFSMLMALARPFMKNKLASRIFVHGKNLKKLYELISPENLPEKYGGIGEEYDPLPLLDELRDSLLQRGDFTFAQTS